MLSGLLYCAHCGKKLVGGYCIKYSDDGPKYRPIYRCYNKQTKAKNCQGQTVYSARKIEKAVKSALNDYFKNIRFSVNSEWREKAREHFAKLLVTRLGKLEKELAALQQEEKMLKDEAIKSLHGDGAYTRELLGEMFARNRESMEKCMTEINRCHTEQAAAVSHMKYLNEQYKYVCDWADKLEYAPDDLKKLIIARFIEHITIDRDYRITIYFYISSEDFHFDTAEKNGDVVIEMTEHPLIKVVECE